MSWFFSPIAVHLVSKGEEGMGEGVHVCERGERERNKKRVKQKKSASFSVSPIICDHSEREKNIQGKRDNLKRKEKYEKPAKIKCIEKII